MQLEFEAGDDKEYKINGIRDNAVYIKESTIGQLPGLYYLVLWKGYLEEKNIWKLVSAIQHLQRLVNTYHKDNSEKPIAISAPIDMAPLIARLFVLPRPTAKPTIDIPIKQKRGQSAGSTTTTKQAKKSQTSFLLNPFRFCSLVLLLVQEVLHQSYFMDLSVFLLSIPLGQEVFHQLITYVLILIVPFRARSMILRNLVFLSHFLICR